MKLKVEEMHCEGCVARIHKALTAAGIPHDVSLTEKIVTVSGDDSVVEKAVEELSDLGFSAVKEG